MFEPNKTPKTPRTFQEGQSKFQISAPPPPRKMAKRKPTSPPLECRTTADTGAQFLASQMASINPSDFDAVVKRISTIENRVATLENKPDLYVTSESGPLKTDVAIHELILSDRSGPDMTLGKPSCGQGEEIPEHTISHPVGFHPVNCSCTQ